MKTFSLLLAALCASLGTSQAADKIRVSSFSTILTEIAERVGGDRVAVTGHVKAGVDPHEFEPKPSDLKTVGNAQLVLLTAKHMEGYVGKLKEATGMKGDLLEVGNGFASLKMKAEGDPNKIIEDPHWWHSIPNEEKAVKIVRDALIKISPADKDLFTANAAKFLVELDDLEKWTRQKIAELPRDKRKLVTSHDAFQYFARDHGFTIYAIEGVTTQDQPSSKKVADLISTIEAQHVKAIFLESIENPKVLKEITKETGAKVGGTLYADGLGEGDTSTYVGMYKHNVSTIVDALK
ncbi:MAG TPA: metal ABC transporter substrate-binding protein [Chthoniobacter sp.]|jgi:ABC-type Zn uptake system ZnuABC Zn-binding protein ZnuA